MHFKHQLLMFFFNIQFMASKQLLKNIGAINADNLVFSELEGKNLANREGRLTTEPKPKHTVNAESKKEANAFVPPHSKSGSEEKSGDSSIVLRDANLEYVIVTAKGYCDANGRPLGEVKYECSPKLNVQLFNKGKNLATKGVTLMDFRCDNRDMSADYAKDYKDSPFARMSIYLSTEGSPAYYSGPSYSTNTYETANKRMVLAISYFDKDPSTTVSAPTSVFGAESPFPDKFIVDMHSYPKPITNYKSNNTPDSVLLYIGDSYPDGEAPKIKSNGLVGDMDFQHRAYDFIPYPHDMSHPYLNTYTKFRKMGENIYEFEEAHFKIIRMYKIPRAGSDVLDIDKKPGSQGQLANEDFQKPLSVDVSRIKPSKSDIFAYPNPVRRYSELTCEVKSNGNENIKVDLFNSTGQKVYGQEVAPQDASKFGIEMVYPPGVYILRITQAGVAATTKVVIN
jgi:hypothetical protein